MFRDNFFGLLLFASTVSFCSGFKVTDTRRSPTIQQRQHVQEQTGNMIYLSEATLNFDTSTKRPFAEEEYYDFICTLQNNVNKGEVATFIQRHGEIESVNLCKNDSNICPEVSYVICMTAADGTNSGVIRIQQ